MPVERNAQRLATPLAARDKRVLGLVAGLAAIGVAGSAYAYASGSTTAAGNGNCVTVTVTSTMGGATVRTCGVGQPAARRSSSSTSRQTR